MWLSGAKKLARYVGSPAISAVMTPMLATTPATWELKYANTSEARSFMDRTMILSAPMPPGSTVRSYCGLPSVFVTPTTAAGVRTEASTTLPARGARASERRASSLEAASPDEVPVERRTRPEDVAVASAW